MNGLQTEFFEMKQAGGRNPQFQAQVQLIARRQPK
jgi:hypothetical protein